MATTKVTTPVTDFDKPNTEEGLKIPSGTSSNQPTGVEGMVRNDTTQSSKGSSSAITYYNGTNWRYFENELNTSFNTVLYTGTSLTNAITGVGFSPDLVWLKQRNSAQNHGLFDTVRGTNNFIMSNSTSAENTRTTDTLSSFDADGFTLTPYSSDAFINYTGRTMVAWCFKAGGAASLNEEGDIDSQVSANNYLGFSIVKYQGNGSSTGATIGHGLDTPPEMIIVKDLDATSDWAVYSSATGNTKKLLLNSANTASTSGVWNNTSPTSSVFTVRYSQTNEVNHDFIAYCFASKPNYSKTGSYVGNGNATGPTVTLGFEPAFVMIKEVTNTGNWRMMDNTRQTTNPKSDGLFANLSNAESTSSTNLVDFNSDNFQVVGTGSDVNTNNSTYIYLAFANTI